ncbi:hypothetical protein [Chryseobacterium sp. sg2396]|uniref:hypothetical protein n=1 Tax=Chryseobacterium sp. sg2396 TaxID=3276280 RepID=UPI0025DF6D6A|nr:hypothetical protein [uncultured Chryseobacterium sp.]
MISNYFFFGCKFPLPLPDGLPVVLGPFGTTGLFDVEAGFAAGFELLIMCKLFVFKFLLYLLFGFRILICRHSLSIKLKSKKQKKYASGNKIGSVGTKAFFRGMKAVSQETV